MRREQIYRKELDSALKAGLSETDARLIAAERTEEIYWDMVDRGREAAKTRD